MSIVVAVTKNNRTVMAADSLSCFGEAQRIPSANCPTDKIRRVGAAIFGGTGWAVYDDILSDYLIDADAPVLEDERTIFAFFLELWKALHDKYQFVNDQSREKDSPFGDLDSSFLIASKGGIFKVSHDMNVTRFNQYYAIGCAQEYALGALHNIYDREDDAQTIARQAVQTAIEFDVHCGGDVLVMDVQ